MMYGVVVWNTDVTKQWNIKTKLLLVKIEYFVFKYTKKVNKKNTLNETENRGRKRIVTDVLVWKMLLMSNPSLFHKDSKSISVWKCNSKMKVLVTIQYVCNSSHHNNVILKDPKQTPYGYLDCGRSLAPITMIYQCCVQQSGRPRTFAD